MMKMLKKADIVLISLLLIISFIPLALNLVQPAVLTADIKVAGTLKQTVLLTAHQGTDTIHITTPNGHNTIVIKDASIAVTDADCPDKVCVKTGFASQNGDVIACLPHKLIIEVKGGEASRAADVISP